MTKMALRDENQQLSPSKMRRIEKSKNLFQKKIKKQKHTKK